MWGAGGRDSFEPARIVVWVVAAAAVGAGAWLWVSQQAAEAPAVEPTSEPVAVATSEPSPTQTATPTPTATATSEPPTPTPTSTLDPAPPGQTVLFRGGPATGPWQQIGSVAEITHPDADPRAATAYREYWSDPAEENQPDWLWDLIVAEVTEDAVALGVPLDRPAFFGDERGIPFHAFGGMEQVFPDAEAFTATWSVNLARADGVAVQVHWPYVIGFAGESIRAGEPFSIVEDEIANEAALEATIRDQLAEFADPIIAERLALQ